MEKTTWSMISVKPEAETLERCLFHLCQSRANFLLLRVCRVWDLQGVLESPGAGWVYPIATKLCRKIGLQTFSNVNCIHEGSHMCGLQLQGLCSCLPDMSWDSFKGTCFAQYPILHSLLLQSCQLLQGKGDGLAKQSQDPQTLRSKNGKFRELYNKSTWCRCSMHFSKIYCTSHINLGVCEPRATSTPSIGISLWIHFWSTHDSSLMVHWSQVGSIWPCRHNCVSH